MKKLSLFSSLCAAALLTACSSEEPISNNGAEVSDGNARYLSVNIVSNTGNGTRAEAGDQVKGDPEGSLYEKGLDAENKVTKVRFYFFDNDGEPAYVKAGREVNWYDWIEGITTPAAPDDQKMPNVEKILNATIVISTKAGDNFPSQMLAVVNPRTDLGEDAYSLEDIRNITADYALHANGDINNKTDYPGNYFPMCNAVYAENGQIVSATKITTNDYKTTEADAKANPVQIFVERNVAKVRTSLDLDSESMEITDNGLIKLKSKDKDGKVSDIELPFTDITDTSNPTTENKQIYLKIEGWNVTADMEEATLSKYLKKSLWTNDELGFEWNNPAYHRSYWAAALDDTNSRYGNFEAAKAKKFFNDTNSEDERKGFTYANENTIAQGNVNYLKRNTKIIIAGILCDEKGNALTLCEYYGIKFVDDDNQTNLKKSVLNYLTDNGLHNYFRKVGNTVVSIGPDDITFKYAKVVTEKDSKGLYYVIPTMTETAMGYTWFDNNEDLITEHRVSANKIKDDLEASQHAKIWNTGMTYYYADINHFGTDRIGDKVVARRGVVRNHIYDMTINTIYGLGTPVWDPNTNIIPEKTEDDDTYIGAQINILSWRIVNNKVDLEW